MGSVTKEMLDLVFGEDSCGATAGERARNSRRRFVRSQVQITFASEKATGRVLSAHEALQTFGWDILLQIATDGSARIVQAADEPATTLKAQRQELGLTVSEVARQLSMTEAELSNAETPGKLSSIRMLERLGSALALDERRLGHKRNAGRDSELGVRLRELRKDDTTTFGAGTVLGLSEAAWVISRQAYLSKALGFISPRSVALPAKDSNFGLAPFKLGYSLAERTRSILSLSSEEPIESLRILIEEVLELPLVQQAMDARFAGATIANGRDRGIVVNEKGMNTNVWVRRITLCHEIGHLLWDPDDKLAKLKVDEYSDINSNALDQRRDPVEARANAFAVAFLAPPDGVRQIAKAYAGNVAEIVSRVMTTYGIGGAAAKHHVHNVASLDTLNISITDLPLPTDDWSYREDLTIAFFPIRSTPITRRGKFAWFVAKSVARGMLSEDTAAAYLKCEISQIREHLATILDMWPEEPGAADG